MFTDCFNLQFFNFCGRGVFANAADAVFTAGLGLVIVGNGDDLAVAGPEPKPEVAGSVLIQLEFWVGNHVIRFRQVFHRSGSRGFSDTFDALAAGGPGFVDLGGGNALAVGRKQVKFVAGRYPADQKFAHGIPPLSPIVAKAPALRNGNLYCLDT